jgi:ribosomal protein L16 Arg81 hydroxylase
VTDEIVATSDVTYEWHRWVAISLLRGTPVATAVQTMTDEGVPEDQAAAACARLLTDPTFEAAEWAMGQLRKLESVLDMRRQMENLAHLPLEVDRRSGLSREEFLQEYYARNRPVVLEDVCDKWPAITRWSPEYLAETLAAAEVEVMADREGDEDYEVNANRHRTRMPFDEYVAKVLATEWGNDLYLVANNKLLESKVARPLWDDFSLDPRYLVPDTKRKLTFLWFGPAGTVTKLHHDLMNILFHQIDGWKQFILISPLETHCLSNMIGVYSDVDPQAPNLTRFPRYEAVRPLQVSVGPGDALFVPVGWWHHVTALETSISVSTTSFAFPNSVPWANPNKIL